MNCARICDWDLLWQAMTARCITTSKPTCCSCAVNGYGDVAVFQLPKSGLVMQISIKKWYRADPNNTDDYVIPDYPCEGRAALETLYKLIEN